MEAQELSIDKIIKTKHIGFVLVNIYTQEKTEFGDLKLKMRNHKSTRGSCIKKSAYELKRIRTSFLQFRASVKKTL